MKLDEDWLKGFGEGWIYSKYGMVIDLCRPAVVNSVGGAAGPVVFI